MKNSARYILLVLILLLAMIACVGSGWGGDRGRSGNSSRSSSISAYDITATYGSELFHEQLTAIAQTTPAAQSP